MSAIERAAAYSHFHALAASVMAAHVAGAGVGPELADHVLDLSLDIVNDAGFALEARVLALHVGSVMTGYLSE